MPLLLCYDGKDRASLLNAAEIGRTRTRHDTERLCSRESEREFFSELPFLSNLQRIFTIDGNSISFLWTALPEYFSALKSSNRRLCDTWNFHSIFTSRDRILFLLSFCEKTAAREVVFFFKLVLYCVLRKLLDPIDI